MKTTFLIIHKIKIYFSRLIQSHCVLIAIDVQKEIELDFKLNSLIFHRKLTINSILNIESLKINN